MSETTEQSAVLTRREGRVMIITINRPEARNAINGDVHMGVGRAMEEAGNDPDIWAVIITGAGDKAFCAGADLKGMAARGAAPLPAPDERQMKWGFAGFVTHHISKPTIAAVNGFALGGGTEIVLTADLAVAADTATLGLPEVKRGIIAGAGGAFRLQTQVPRKIAMEILLTGEPITAQRALELGLVNAVVPQREVLDAALKLAARITVNAPLSVQASKRIARGIADGVIADEQAGWTRTYAEIPKLMQSEDAREGPRAFAEKRAPVWKGK